MESASQKSGIDLQLSGQQHLAVINELCTLGLTGLN
jgi:hypothetical protein